MESESNKLIPLESTSQLTSSGSLEASTSFTKTPRRYDKWSPSEEGVTLTWEDLTVHVNGKINGRKKYLCVLNRITGVVKAGSLVAVMGASGAGKSTLMSVLAHRNPADMRIDGEILINGRPIGNYMKYISGFMDQHDIFVSTLTVWEHMNIMAHLKLDKHTTSEERKFKIMELLNDLGLIECLNTRIGEPGVTKTLSGGERKRLAFATELLTNPPLLFCDEPTTGLDSFSAQKIISIMNNMTCNGGKTIICTIHQPSSEIFAMFGQLILLAEGKIVYVGNTENVVNFFNKSGYECPKNYNPADYIIQTLAITPGNEERCYKRIDRLCKEFRATDYHKEIEVIVKYESHMGRAEKILAFVIGVCYFNTTTLTQTGVQSIVGLAFVIITENTFSPMYSCLQTFPAYFPLFLREYKSGYYSIILYYISRLVAMFPGLLIEPITFVTIVYCITNLRWTFYAFVMTVLSAVITMNVSTACGVFFSNAFNSLPMAMTYLIPFDVLLMMTSGIFVKLTTLSAFISWVKYLSWLMYGYEAINIVQWQGVINITCYDNKNNLPCISTGTEVLEKFGFSEDQLYYDFLNTLIICFGFYLLGFICLCFNTKKK